MSNAQKLFYLALVPIVFFAEALSAQGPQSQSPPSSADVPTFRVTSSLVFLDVTVLDKKGHPVVKGLTKADFAITEDKKPQDIFSFEAPETHAMATNADDDNAEGKAPVSIFVLDQLNSTFEDFAIIRNALLSYLEAQPKELNAPAELMVVGNQTLETIQGYTRSKDDLLYALKHLPRALPFKVMNGSFSGERLGQSLDALQQIALQNRGVPGRKNVVWVGQGGPSLSTHALPSNLAVEAKQYLHATVNKLVDSRISLFLIFPKLSTVTPLRTYAGTRFAGADRALDALNANAVLNNNDPFAGDVNFGMLVTETGGQLFENGNDVDRLIARSQRMGSDYYTLTYHPHGGDANGRFRYIRVTLRDSSLHVVTKAGYYAPDSDGPNDPRQQRMTNLAEAAQSGIPFTALDVKISSIIQHPDSRTAELTLQFKGKNLTWTSADEGLRTSSLIMAGASLDGRKGILASKIEKVTLTSKIQDPTRLTEGVSFFPLTVRVPRKTKTVRVVLETEDGGRIGASEVDRKVIDGSPAKPTLEPGPQPTAP